MITHNPTTHEKNHCRSFGRFLFSPFMRNRFGLYSTCSFLQCFSHVMNMKHQVLSTAHKSRSLSPGPHPPQPLPWASTYMTPWDRNKESRTTAEMENQERHDTRARILDGGTVDKPGVIPGEQLEVFYYTCCVLSQQIGRSGQQERMLSRYINEEVTVTNRP